MEHGSGPRVTFAFNDIVTWKNQINPSIFDLKNSWIMTKSYLCTRCNKNQLHVIESITKKIKFLMVFITSGIQSQLEIYWRQPPYEIIIKYRWYFYLLIIFILDKNNSWIIFFYIEKGRILKNKVVIISNLTYLIQNLFW